ncbi:MAG: sugar ABC transporter ATP-binding protein [Planctomycetales bacterium]|nr:sugar ABC transporter ATP-binding protein [Planctomycetales bacterium]
MSATTPLLQVQEVSKQFPGVLALNRVSMQVRAGEVLAVIGENGAGKSTLMKIMAGVQLPDSGQLLLNGEPVQLPNCRTAMAHGVVLIHQELNLADNLTVAANISLGREPQWPKTGPVRFIDHQAIHAEARRCLDLVGLDVDPQALVSSLPVGKQQLVEIAKALSINARILIMDEPTSSLSSGEAERLFEVVKELRSRGVSIVYISHRLGEVEELADHVTVLRDGANAGELDREEITHDRMVQMMVGRDVSQFYSREPHPVGDVVLETENLVTPAWPGERINIRISAGEIVGIAGLVGAGRTELLQVLFGVVPAAAGAIRLCGETVKFDSPQDAIQRSVALVPEDRKQHGLVIEMSIRHNIGLAGLRKNQRAGFLNHQQEHADTTAMIQRLGIRTPSENQVARLLSGGNQQKVVLGKWLTMGPRLLLLDEPTRGIDVGAKQEIYSLMDALAREGMAILFVSSEMEEILGMSDRVYVMHQGALSGELSREQASEESVMQLATRH